MTTNPKPLPGDVLIDNSDPFDLGALTLDQSFIKDGGAKKLLLTVPIRKPGKHDFVRTHSSEAYRKPFALVELKGEDREVFLLPPETARALPGEYSQYTLHTAISRQGVLFLWPVRRITDNNARVSDWHKSAVLAAARAETTWVRVVADMALGAYQVYEASGSLPDPVWPDVSYAELVRIGFGDRIVRDLSHPLVQRLLGAV